MKYSNNTSNSRPHSAPYQIFTTKICVRNITSLHISKQARFGEF